MSTTAAHANPTEPIGFHIPIDRIDPDPLNRKSPPDDALVASVKEHGVLQPILVKPTTNDRWQIIAGERRWRAALAAKLETVPAVARDVDEQTIGVLQAVENLHRSDLAPSQEAAAVVRCLDAGMSQKELATKIGRPVSWVRARRVIVSLPAEVQQAIDTGVYEVSDAATLAKYADRPEVIAKAQEFGGYSHRDPAWQLERAAGVVEAERAVAELRAAAEAKGWAVQEGWNLGPYSSARSLTELGIDVTAHEAEPCHLIHLYNSQTTPYCTEPKRHSPRGESELVAPAKKKPKLTPAQVKERAAVARTKKINAHRAAFVLDAINGKLRPRDMTSMVLPVMLAAANMEPLKHAARLLGIEPSVTQWGHKDYATPFRAWAGESNANLQRAMLALAYCVAMVAWTGGGAREAVDAWLVDLGYDESAIDTDVAA